MYGQINGIPLSDVSATMLLMLYGRVMESRSANPLLKDPKGEEIVAQINDSLLHSEQKLFRRLAQFKMSRNLSVHAALRARQYDLYTLEFMAAHPDCTVVNLGCGLDTRFWRVDNGRVRFFDLDLPGVIELKHTLVQETDRYHLVARSVLDPTWMEIVLADEQPVILLAEGLFMYLPKPEVQALVAAMGQGVTTGQLVAEVVNESYTRGFNKWVVGYKFKHELGFGQAMSYSCGIKDSNELEAWSPRLHLIDDWSYFDADTDKLGWARLAGRFKAYRQVQWTVRYRIGD
jgi:O-methyltransferase involved in polyketide biosynthesis